MPDHAARLRRIDGLVGWRTTTLRKPNGVTMLVATAVLVDAYLRVMFNGQDQDSEEAALMLPPPVSQFLAFCIPPPGDMFRVLRGVSRRVWSLDPVLNRVVPRGERPPEGVNPPRAH